MRAAFQLNSRFVQPLAAVTDSHQQNFFSVFFEFVHEERIGIL